MREILFLSEFREGEHKKKEEKNSLLTKARTTLGIPPTGPYKSIFNLQSLKETSRPSEVQKNTPWEWKEQT